MYSNMAPTNNVSTLHTRRKSSVPANLRTRPHLKELVASYYVLKPNVLQKVEQ